MTSPNLLPGETKDPSIVIVESTVTAERVAASLVETLTPADLYQLFRELEDKVAAATYPPLVISRRDLTNDTEHDIEERGLFEFTCPYCGNTRDEMTAVEVSFLAQDSDEIDDYAIKNQQVHFDYEADPGFHELVYVSACCEQPVTMPAGWTEA